MKTKEMTKIGKKNKIVLEQGRWLLKWTVYHVISLQVIVIGA